MEISPDPEPNVIHLKKRTPEQVQAYWEGYRAGLKNARDAIQKSLDHLDDMLISHVPKNGNN